MYKVPQDVEAEDKLLGPFSFKQFVFLIITVMAIGMAYALFQLLPPLAIIPLPFAVFFGALALPLRKDQPMEVYLAAVISFLMKPKIRLWKPDGIESLIEVIALPPDEKLYGKGYSQEEVSRRMSYLANIVDSRGWAVRGAAEPNSPMQVDLYNEAQAIDDLLDDGGSRAQRIDTLLVQNDQERRQQLIDNMRNPQPIMPLPAPIAPTQPFYSPVDQAQSVLTPSYTPMSIIQSPGSEQNMRLVVNPYPTMNQAVITPIGQQYHAPAAQPVQVVQPVTYAQPQLYEQPQPYTQPQPYEQPVYIQTSQITQAPIQAVPVMQQQMADPNIIPTLEPPQQQPTIEEPISPAIIDLVNNHNDLSVETLRREAERIRKREVELANQGDEVVISLR